jgi:hypothetical protein
MHGEKYVAGAMPQRGHRSQKSYQQLFLPKTRRFSSVCPSEDRMLRLAKKAVNVAAVPARVAAIQGSIRCLPQIVCW